MERLRRIVYDEMGEIKKGPWKTEEDEVLINHVNKYGPRDWSSIRSKGLLQRTGKSCRLRWINKLRPNLKNGVKFSAEEERTVIELQAQFGNKWARIATYLPGRTDNDVKNFWSSRQKRLARILQTSTPPPSTKSQKNSREGPVLYYVQALEALKCSSSTEEESSSKIQSCSSSINNLATTKMMPLQELLDPNLLNFQQNNQIQPCHESQLQLSFPQIPQLQPDLAFSIESKEFIARLGDPNFLEMFGGHAIANPAELDHNVQLQPELQCLGTENLQNGGEGENGNPVTPDSFIDDFPMDMFDQIESLPSPSEW